MTDILFGYDHLLIRAAYRTPDLHRHLLCHLIVSLQGDVTCMANGDKFTASGLFIGSDVEHTVYTERGELLLFLFDKTSDFVRQIEKNYLKGKSYAVMEPGLVDKIRQKVLRENGDLKKLDRELPGLCGIDQGNGEAMDERVRSALGFLKELDTVPEDAMKRMAELVCLSESRLSHLFKQDTGIALGRYLALEKMRKGYLHFAATGNITDAALRAGFDSPSHFAATCKRMFGISFSEFVKS